MKPCELCGKMVEELAKFHSGNGEVLFVCIECAEDITDEVNFAFLERWKPYRIPIRGQG